MSRYLLLGAFLQSDPVLAVGTDVHLVGPDPVGPLGLLGDGSLRSDGRHEPQEAQVHLGERQEAPAFSTPGGIKPTTSYPSFKCNYFCARAFLLFFF